MDKRVNIVVVTGANSGLGAAICNALYALPRTESIKINGPAPVQNSFDLTDPDELMGAGSYIRRRTEELKENWCIKDEHVYPILINCAGVNYIEWFDAADWSEYDRLMNVNVKVPMMLAQELIGPKPPSGDDPWFRGKGAILNIISNASHMPMTNSAFYNASKGALHIATLAMARELRKTHGLTVFGISPNKLAGTGMSNYIEGRVPSLRGWTPEEAAKYQLGALPAGEETDPAQLAEFIAWILSSPQRHKYLTNTVLPYGA